MSSTLSCLDIRISDILSHFYKMHHFTRPGATQPWDMFHKTARDKKDFLFFLTSVTHTNSSHYSILVIWLILLKVLLIWWCGVVCPNQLDDIVVCNIC